MARNINTIPPKHMPGKGVVDVVRKQPFLVKAAQLDAGDFTGYGTTQMLNVPANTMVTDIFLNISEAFTASVTMTVGDGADADRFMDSTAIAPQTVGWKSMKQDAQPGSGGYIYTSADTIDLTLAGATPSAGTMDVYFSCVLNVDEIGLSLGQ